MSHWLLFAILAIACMALAYVTWQLARLGDWLIGWLHGCAIMLLAVLVFVTFSLAYTMTRLQAVDGLQSLASISVSAVDRDNFFLEIADRDGKSWYTSMSGDGWQVSARGVRFRGGLGILLKYPAARLHSVSNRYYDFARRGEARSVVVAPSPIENFFGATGLDLWLFAEQVFSVLEPLGFQHQVLQSDVIPLVNDAIYSVHWNRTYLEIKPANEAARLGMTPEVPAPSTVTAPAVPAGQ